MHSPTSELLEYITDLAHHVTYLDSRYCILLLLMELEIREHNDGFTYLRIAIHLLSEEPEQMITKGLYPAVARRSGKNVSSEVIERSVRNAIKTAWCHHNNTWDVLFPSGKCPSNGDFIARIAKLVELWKGCCEAYHHQTCEEVALHEARG